MNTKVTALALALVSCGASAQLSEPDFYGRVWLGATFADNGIATKEKVAGTALENYASRVGVKGNYQINQALQLIYQIELGVDGFDEDYKKDPLNARDTFLGIKGAYGSALVGRKNTVLKSSEGPVDAFNATNADMSYMLAGQDRLSDQLILQSAQHHGLSLHASYVLEEDFEGSAKLADAHNFAISGHYGDKKFKTSPLFVSLTWADGLNGVDVARVAAAYKLDNLKLGALWQDTDSLNYDQLGGQSYLLSAQYQAGKSTFKAQFINDESGLGKVVKNAVSGNGLKLDNLSDASGYNVSLGIDHQLSKALMVGVLASYHDGDFSANGQTIAFDDTTATAHLRFVF